MRRISVKNLLRPWHGAFRTAGALFLAFVFLFALLEVMAAFTWHLSGAGRVDLARLRQMSSEVEWPPKSPFTPENLSTELASWQDPRAAMPWFTTAPQRFPAWPAHPPVAYTQSPTLDARVAAGELPPVAKRLPEQPLVCIPFEQCGPYGGDCVTYAATVNDLRMLESKFSYDYLFRWSARGQRLEPNIATRLDISPDGCVFTIHLRKGIRWSDGQPFTADDIEFAYEHVLKNAELSPVLIGDFRQTVEVPDPAQPGHLKTESVAASFRKLDPYTVQFSFPRPNGVFRYNLAMLAGGELVRYPKHYLKQFHPDFLGGGERGRKAADAIAAKYQMPWYQFFMVNRVVAWNPECPRLWPWILRTEPKGQIVIAERNPYYWKIDPQGRQLPYIDKLTIQMMEADTADLKYLSGDFGLNTLRFRADKYPVFVARRERGHYRVLLWPNTLGNAYVLALNLNHRDPVMKEIFHDRRFREALSLAINRQEINSICFLGMGAPRQEAPLPESPFSYEKLATQHLAFDPARANALLDAMGLKRGPDGVRLRPDGKRLEMTLESQMLSAGTEALQLVAEHWTNVGVKTVLKVEASPLFYQRKAGLVVDVSAFPGTEEMYPVLDPRWFLPFTIESNHMIGYFTYLAGGGKSGEKPTPEIQRCYDLYQQVLQTSDEAAQIGLFRQLLELNAEQFWMIGTVGNLPDICLVHNTMRNVPPVANTGWMFRSFGNIKPECLAIQPEQPGTQR